jgi:hypothetical protein
VGIGGRDQGHEIYKYRQIISEGIIEAQPLPPQTISTITLQYNTVEQCASREKGVKLNQKQVSLKTRREEVRIELFNPGERK